MPRTIKYKKYLIKSLKSPKEASAYLNVALDEFAKDGDKKVFLSMLRDVTEAQGGISALSEKTGLNRQNLYQVLSGKGNPRISTLGNILNGLGLRLLIKVNR